MLAVDHEMRRVEHFPSRHRAGPFAGNFRQRHDPGARVLAALGVVGRGRRHAVRPLLRPRVCIVVVKRIDGKRFGGGVATDLVEREQAVVAIEGGVLERLRHHRPGELLHLQRKAAHARRAVREPGRAGSGPWSARRGESRKCRRRRRTSRRRALLDGLARSARGRAPIGPAEVR